MLDEIYSVFEAKYRRFDIRYMSEKVLVIELKNGTLEKLYSTNSSGYAIRVVESNSINYAFVAGVAKRAT